MTIVKCKTSSISFKEQCPAFFSDVEIKLLSNWNRARNDGSLMKNNEINNKFDNK